MKSLFALLAILLAAPSFAGSRACSASLVTAGVCRSSTDRLAYVSVATSDAADLTAALAAQVGWAANVTCGTDMIAAGACTQQQYNQTIANPETRQAAADRALRRLLINAIRAYREQAATAAAAAAVPDPDVAP